MFLLFSGVNATDFDLVACTRLFTIYVTKLVGLSSVFWHVQIHLFSSVHRRLGWTTRTANTRTLVAAAARDAAAAARYGAAAARYYRVDSLQLVLPYLWPCYIYPLASPEPELEFLVLYQNHITYQKKIGRYEKALGIRHNLNPELISPYQSFTLTHISVIHTNIYISHSH